jgi:hypothetical protein
MLDAAESKKSFLFSQGAEDSTGRMILSIIYFIVYEINAIQSDKLSNRN